MRSILRFLLRKRKTDNLVPLTLVPVEVFGEDDGYGLMDAVSAWSDCNRAEGRIYRVEDFSPAYRLPGESVQVWVRQEDVEFFQKNWSSDPEEMAATKENVIEELLESIRLTQEYAQNPAVEGWSWYDTYKKYRPEDAERLRAYWQKGVDNGTW